MPTTVTASVTPAGRNSRSSANSWPAASGIPVYSSGAKPAFSARMVYMRRLEAGDDVVALVVRLGDALLAGAFVLRDDLRAAEERAALIAHRARESGLFTLRCRR